jgi:hypothetical protein
MTDNKFTPDGLPMLNKHYRIADQVLYGVERRKKGEFQFECHSCIGEECNIHSKCEQFARLKATESKELMKQE